MLQERQRQQKTRASSIRKSFRTLSLIGGLLLLVILFITVARTLPQWYNLRFHLGGDMFVTTSGTQLMVNGSPLRLVGYNWHWMGTGCPAPTDVEIDTTFALIKTASHGNVVRTAFYQSGSNNGAYTDFDRYIKYAKKHGLYIVPMLVNHWDSCEPTETKTASWYQSGYKQPDNGYSLSFRTYAIKLAQYYANEPTIAFWQLVNEPDPGPCGATGAQILRNFADDMTIAIKTVDPHHIVDLGVPGRCAGDNTTDYAKIVSGQVDLCDVWHDYGQIAAPLPSQMQQRLSVCQSLNKPSFVGESSICADIVANQTCSGTITVATLDLRATLFAAKLSAGFNAGLAGYIIWNKGGESNQSDVGPGDPTESIVAKYGSP
jgi:hypothetical protein